MASTTLYQSLDDSNSQIRLLRILPGANHDPIQCIMGTASLETHPELYYDALSYEWGSPKRQREITVQGKLFMIRENLWNALYQLRSIQFCGPIWIDAICINQEDLKERNTPVNMVHVIYSSANCVRVWLGQEVKEGPQTGSALAFLSRMFEFVRDVGFHASRKLIKHETDSQDLLVIEKVAAVRGTLNLYDFFSAATEDEGDYAVSILKQRWQKLLSTNDDGWLALASLLTRNYWSRIWIVQEYVLAQHRIIHCGRHIIDIEKLDVAIAHILRLDLGRHPDINSRIQDSISRIQTSPGALIVKYAIPWLSLRRSILELLVACKNSEAAEPRDKIYEILGLTWDIWSLDFEVDYAKPIFEIKCDVLRSYLSLNWSADCRKKAAKLWFMLNEMLPETVDTPTRNEMENVAQSIINEVRTIPPRIRHIQTIIEQFGSDLHHSFNSPLELSLVNRTPSLIPQKHSHRVNVSWR